MTSLSFAVNVFIALFALIDPIGCAPIFAASTQHVKPASRWRVAGYVALFALAFLAFFFFTGLGLLKFFGISLPAFRIAGGVMLLLTGLHMAREDFSPAAAEAVVEGEITDPAAYARREFEKLIVPFGMPLLIGPGAISAVVIFAGQATELGWAGRGAGLAAIAVLSLTIFVSFVLSGLISRALGKVGTVIVVRVLGLILTALAVQFIIVGVSEATAGFVKRSVANPYPQRPAAAAPHAPRDAR